MKNYLSIILSMLVSTCILPGCKKDNTSSAKDFTASIKDKSWWGAFTYAAKEAEYYSVHFNADNTLLWSQFSGDLTGQWAINGKELTMTFDISKAEIKAGISDDNKLENITDNTENSEINTGQLITNSIIPLDNTEWKGEIVSGTPYIVDMSFRPPFKIDLQIGFNYTNSTYTRSPSGAVIRADIKALGSGASTSFFGVIISGNEMMGSNKSSNIQWKATKK